MRIARRGWASARSAGCKLAILSNELDLFYGAGFRQRLPLLKQFDAIIDATYTGVLKPDPQAYRLCEQAIGIAGENCIFLDDQPRNIDGARALGWQCVPFDVADPAGSYEQALRLCSGIIER